MVPSPKEAEVHFLEPIRSTHLSSSPSTADDEVSKTQFRPRSLSHHLSSPNPPSREWLRTQARFWRFLMKIAIYLHDLAPPKPPQPSFVSKIATLPHGSEPISLLFYTPRDYNSRVKAGHRFPVLVNFHGGGFCIGDPADDRYWARVVVADTDAVVVSVGYRLAPEHPFPIPVDDCVDALLYLSTNAESLGLDTTRVALSGFSAGANLCFTVPLRLENHTRKEISPSSSSSGDDISRWPSTQKLLSAYTGLHIVSIVAWYPLLDWSLSRNEKRRHSVRPEKTLPKFFTDLFDHAYLPPPRDDHTSAYASPALASSEMLRQSIPHDVQMFICEWDMLLMEGKKFSQRLHDLGKNVQETLIPKVPHGWDKSPSPWRNQKAIDALYSQACTGLKKSFA